jgi:hypothetical protein
MALSIIHIKHEHILFHSIFNTLLTHTQGTCKCDYAAQRYMHYTYHAIVQSCNWFCCWRDEMKHYRAGHSPPTAGARSGQWNTDKVTFLRVPVSVGVSYTQSEYDALRGELARSH